MGISASSFYNRLNTTDNTSKETNMTIPKNEEKEKKFDKDKFDFEIQNLENNIIQTEGNDLSFPMLNHKAKIKKEEFFIYRNKKIRPKDYYIDALLCTIFIKKVAADKIIKDGFYLENENFEKELSHIESSRLIERANYKNNFYKSSSNDHDCHDRFHYQSIFVFKKECENKHCESRKTSKKLSLSKVKQNKGKFIKLCPSCFKAWNNNQYCYYCCAIYKDNNIETNVDGKSWIMCDGCTSWVYFFKKASHKL
jgi:hypothetical protein